MKRLLRDEREFCVSADNKPIFFEVAEEVAYCCLGGKEAQVIKTKLGNYILHVSEDSSETFKVFPRFMDLVISLNETGWFDRELLRVLGQLENFSKEV